MSDNGDETIDAGPEVLRAVQDAAKLRAAAEEPGSINEPVRVWTLDDADLTTGQLNVDDASVNLSTDDDETVAPYDPEASGQHLGFDDSFDEATRDGSVHTPLEPSGDVAPAPIAASSPKDGSAARDFLRESRERSEAGEAQAVASRTNKRRSGIWIVLSIILGAQIIAGGVYVALNALGADEIRADTNEVVAGAEATEATEPIVVPTPEAVPTPRAAPTPAGTPTPVAPTPTWLPVSDGPRSAPFTFFVEAVVREPGFFDGRDGGSREVEVGGRQVPLVNPLASGQGLVLRVVGGEPGDDWAQVELPGEAAVAWVRSEEFVWDSTELLVQIDVAANSLRVFEGNTGVYSASIASGSRSRPTPELSTYIVEDVPAEGASPGRIRLANFGARTALADGLGALTLEPTDDSDAFLVEAGYTTDGRVLLSGQDFAEVSRLVSAGAKVEIIGVPSAPTPTPVPERPDEPTDESNGGFFGCPPATRGSPPNCYRVVERLTVAGECAGRQVQIEDGCYFLGGNPELDDFGRSCPAGAPQEFDGLCYLKFGPVPQLRGPCPEGASAVRNECRIPA